jgi:hypothetical protein
MRSRKSPDCLRRTLKAAMLLGAAMPLGATSALAVTWQTVVNNSNTPPTSAPQTKTPYFFSYNQPAVNTAGQVVFRARAKPLTGEGGSGGGGEPVRGVYTRSVTSTTGPIGIVADNLAVAVPAPNTTGATFIEFPSTPRADATSFLVATRGQSQPVITLSDGTKLGTSGVYAQASQATASGYQGISALPVIGLTTAASLVGSVPQYSYFQVPGEAPGIRFDQFPGSPSPVGLATTRNYVVAFKGNYTVGTTGKTGVYYRNILGATPSAVQLVVKSGEAIPGFPGYVFGSAAPPSAAKSGNVLKVVFAGFDIEDAPTAGGIYITPLSPRAITPIVSIGGAVPGVSGATFNKFGEGLSFDGRYVSFWGAWGGTRKIYKQCPEDGNRDLIAYCKAHAPLPDYTYELEVPVNQGIFVADTTKTTNSISLVARTGVEGFSDFLYWTYSGRPPGGEETEDAEPPRWRASAFTAVKSDAMAFKGLKGTLDGLYVKRFASSNLIEAMTTATTGQSVDPRAPAGSLVSAIGVERDGFRGNWLSITASMLNATTTESWAGIYVHNCGSNCATW